MDVRTTAIKKKKCPPWLGNYLNHKEKKNIRRGIRMREKGDWIGINEFKKKEYPLPSTVSTVEERGYFTKGYWSSKLLTGFFFNEVIGAFITKKKRLWHLQQDRLFLSQHFTLFALPGVQLLNQKMLWGSWRGEWDPVAHLAHFPGGDTGSWATLKRSAATLH